VVVLVVLVLVLVLVLVAVVVEVGVAEAEAADALRQGRWKGGGKHPTSPSEAATRSFESRAWPWALVLVLALGGTAPCPIQWAWTWRAGRGVWASLEQSAEQHGVSELDTTRTGGSPRPSCPARGWQCDPSQTPRHQSPFFLLPQRLEDEATKQRETVPFHSILAVVGVRHALRCTTFTAMCHSGYNGPRDEGNPQTHKRTITHPVCHHTPERNRRRSPGHASSHR
jgi:hypothetical protein